MKPVVDFIQNNADRYVEELREFCAIPSISTQAEHKPDIERCARWLADHMTHIGLENVEIISTAGHPIVYAEHFVDEAYPTGCMHRGSPRCSSTATTTSNRRSRLTCGTRRPSS